VVDARAVQATLSAFLLLWMTNGLALAGLTVFDAELLTSLEINRAQLKFRDLLTFALAARRQPFGSAVRRL